MEKIAVPWKIAKITWNSTFFKKIKDFWENGIIKFPEKMQKVVEQNSEQIIQ